jgi:hypothetical protein
MNRVNFTYECEHRHTVHRHTVHRTHRHTDTPSTTCAPLTLNQNSFTHTSSEFTASIVLRSPHQHTNTEQSNQNRGSINRQSQSGWTDQTPRAARTTRRARSRVFGISLSQTMRASVGVVAIVVAVGSLVQHVAADGDSPKPWSCPSIDGELRISEHVVVCAP